MALSAYYWLLLLIIGINDESNFGVNIIFCSPNVQGVIKMGLLYIKKIKLMDQLEMKFIRKYCLTFMVALSILPCTTILAANDNSLGIAQLFNPSSSALSDTKSINEQTVKSEQQSIPAPVEMHEITPPQIRDYTNNINSDVFGANLFTGAFAKKGVTQFNPDYVVTVGDKIQARFWGAYEYDAVVNVDPKGNIYLPHVGPIKVMGVRNKDLQRVVASAVKKIFRANVSSYSSLAAAQPVRVYVGGFVNRPGLYRGTSMDSILHYLDQAGGIDPERGSFLNVQIKRGISVRATMNLYDFLLKGHIPLIQLTDGDVIFITTRRNTVLVSGLAENAKRFEFNDTGRDINVIIELAKPLAQATHIRVTRNTGIIKNIEYYPLDKVAGVNLENGDEIEFTADKRPGTIAVRVEGEHLGVQEYVLPYGARMGELLQLIHFSEQADTDSLQLFRKSVVERQEEMLKVTLKKLESSVLTARSGTTEESLLRKNEAELILQWIERAKEIEPSGQVMITQADDIDGLLLENGDIIRVPALDNVVLVSGEVLFPNAIAINSEKTAEDYIEMSGGYSQDSDLARVIIAHRDGSFEDIEENSAWYKFGLGADVAIRPGDKILVLPQVDSKARQVFKELTQMIYQIALAAGVALR